MDLRLYSVIAKVIAIVMTIVITIVTCERYRLKVRERIMYYSGAWRARELGVRRYPPASGPISILRVLYFGPWNVGGHP
jgi:hypothetical protein